MTIKMNNIDHYLTMTILGKAVYFNFNSEITYLIITGCFVLKI